MGIEPETAVNSHLQVTGVCVCPLIDVVRFDNSYSWMSSKKLSYLVEVLTPDNAANDELCKVEDRFSTDL